MKIQTFSVVVGGDACNATCPYCVSKLTGSKRGLAAGQKPMEINKRNFSKACRFAQMSGVSTVLLTGKGEPLIYHQHITRYLEMLEKWDFPFVELQTNGILLKHTAEVLLRDWYDAGLTTICLSCAGYDSVFNKEIFGQDINLDANVELLHRLGFSVRISCVGVGGMVDNVKEIQKFARWCKARNVEQFTWRAATNIPAEEVGDDRTKKSVHDWLNLNYVDPANEKAIREYFDYNTTTLLELTHGAKVYDYEGQNVSINSCLTRSVNPDEVRQLIFSSDGHLRYDWVKEGAIII